jgi:hypothetical protein
MVRSEISFRDFLVGEKSGENLAKPKTLIYQYFWVLDINSIHDYHEKSNK